MIILTLFENLKTLKEKLVVRICKLSKYKFEKFLPVNCNFKIREKIKIKGIEEKIFIGNELCRYGKKDIPFVSMV